MTNSNEKKQLVNVDRLRILAAFGVVSYHAHGDLPRSPGVVGFIILMMFFCIFMVNRPRVPEFSSTLKKKFDRLLAPWLFWSVVYGVVKLAKVVFFGADASQAFSMTMFLTGTRIHLWFLPFAFMASLVLAFICQKSNGASEMRNIVIASILGVVSVFCFSIVSSQYILPVPLGQWMLGFPAVPLGFAIGRSMLFEKSSDRLKLYLCLTLLLVAVCFGVGYMGYAIKYAVRYCGGFLMVCLVLCLDGSRDPVSSRLATLTYGIYLIHPLILVFLGFVHFFDTMPLLVFLITIVLSTIAVVILQKTHIKRFV